MDIKSVITKLRKDIGCNSLIDSRTEITGFISTGDLALNRILSGDPVNGGIPEGKITSFSGESSSGKSFVIANTIINAVKMGYEKVFLCDSEGGSLLGLFKSSNIDMEKIEHIPILSVEDCIIKFSAIFNIIKEYKIEHPESKFLVALDSLGVLESDKFITDAGKGKTSADMGLTAKMKNALMRKTITHAMTTNTPVLVANHIYLDPSAFLTSKIKIQSGGLQAQYVPQIIVQASRNLEKSTEDAENGYYQASILNFFTVKNRIVKPFLSSERYLDFDNPTRNKYYGLLDSAMKYGFITKDGHSYVFNSEKFKKEEILNNDKVWDCFMDDYIKKCKEDLSYKAGDEIKEDEAIVEEK